MYYNYLLMWVSGFNGMLAICNAVENKHWAFNALVAALLIPIALL